MKKISFRIITLLLLMGMPFQAAAAAPEESSSRDFPFQKLFSDEKPKVEVVADSLEYSRGEQKVIAKGNVVLTHRDVQLTSDYAEVETETRKAFARGHVIIFKDGNAVAQGPEVRYNFANDSGVFPDGRIVNPPWYTSGEAIEQLDNDIKLVRGATVTTCDLEKPHYAIQASKMTLYEGDKIIAQNVKLIVLGKPVFWLPYLALPLDVKRPPFSLSAGYNSKFGAYILASKGFSITDRIGGQLHADWRAKRGFGGGVDFDYDFGKVGRGLIKTYWTEDERAPSPGSELGPYAELEDRDRGRITWLHRTDFDDDTFLILRYNRLADEFFLQDFFEREFRSEVEPQSFITFTKNTDRMGGLIHFQKSMNSFERVVERLPEVRLDWKNQPLVKDKIYYESHVSYNELVKKYGRADRDEDVSRLDTNHTWYAPMQWRNFKFMPFGNYRGTYYSRNRDDGDDKFRHVVGYGADLRTHFYKTYDTSSDKFGIEINQLRHIAEPVIKFEAVHSTVSDERLNEFDTADRIDDAQVITLGIENRLQTKRVIDGKMTRVDFVSLNTFLNYEFHPDGASRAGQFQELQEGRTTSNFSVFSQEIVLRPYEWLQYEARADFDVERGQFRIFNQDLLTQARRFKLLFGHRFIRSFNGLEGSNQFVFQGKWTLNALWSFGGYIRWDADRGDLQEWEISASRDLHDFILDFGYNVRNSDIDSSNKELFFNFRFKEFPQFAVQAGQRASFSEPRIGETVAGANQNISRLHQYNEGF